MSAPRSYSPFPGPHYGERVLVRFCNISGPQNLSGCLNSLRATGPWVCKNCRRCGSISAPGFAVPTLLGPLTAGGPRASPTQFRKVLLRTVGEGLKVNRPKAERSHPGVCPYENNTAATRSAVGATLAVACTPGANPGGRMLCAPTGFRWTVGAAISRPPEPFPPWGKDDSPYQGEMSRRDKRGRGARRSRDG